jgi:hypothetical protein
VVETSRVTPITPPPILFSQGLKARRGDLSGPVLAILVTLILLAIGAVIIAYFTLLAGPAPTPVLVVKDQPIAYKSDGDAVVEVVVANIGTANVTLKGGATGKTANLTITGPSGLVNDLSVATQRLASDTAIAPGSSITLRFTFNGGWDEFAPYRSANARLVLVDTAGNTIGQFEVSIRIIGGG